MTFDERGNNIERTLEEIESLVVDGKHVMFTNKIIIDENDLIRLVDDLRNEMPGELQKASRIMEDREQIIAEARQEATSIVDQAKEYANKLVEESEIVVQAQQRSEQIMEQTMQNANQLKDNAEQYANEVFDHMIANVSNALNVLQQAKTELNRKSASERES